MPTGHKHSLATRNKIRKAQIGKNNSFFGKHHSRETLKKLSRINSGSGNVMYGKTHTPQARKKISLAARRRHLMRLKITGVIR